MNESTQQRHNFSLFSHSEQGNVPRSNDNQLQTNENNNANDDSDEDEIQIIEQSKSVSKDQC